MQEAVVNWSQISGPGPEVGRCCRLVRCSIAALAVAFAVTLAPVAAAGAPVAPTPVNSGPPTLSGAPILGKELRCSPGSWLGSPNSFSYVWLRDGSPIAGEEGSGYTVESSDWGHSLSCQVTALNSGGEYTIGGLPSGAYKVKFGRGYENTGNYLLEYYDGQPSSLTATPVSVTAPNVTAGIDAALQPGGEIGGTVTSTAGNPLSDQEVCAFLAAFAGGCARTDAAGQYSISGLAAGLYQVVFYGKGGAVNLATQYYSEKATEADAEPVAVAAGSVSRVDATMQPGGQISGKVTAAEGGQTLAHIGVCALDLTEGEAGECTTTNADGEYTISGLSNGSYTVEFFSEETGPLEAVEDYVPEYYPDKGIEHEAQPVSVAAGSATTGINAEMQRGAEIHGRVSAAADGSPLADILVCATRATDGIEACATTGTAGEYAVSGLPDGSYDVEFVPGLETAFGAAARSNYLGQWYNAKRSFGEAETVSVTAPNTVVGIDAALLTAGQIAGRVGDASTNAPLANAHVCASSHEFGECTFTNASGEYMLSGIPTGSYEVQFSAPEGANYLASAHAGIAVIQGSTTRGVDAQLTAGGEIAGRVTAAADGEGVAGMLVCATEFVAARSSGCTLTNGPGSPATATSNAVAVAAPNNAFELVGKPAFDSKRDELVFFFRVADAGTFHWDLSFGAKKCKKAHAGHRRRCTAARLVFNRGAQTVKSGIVEVRARASAIAMKALDAGGRLRVSGPFSFRSALGGRPARHTLSVVVRPLRRSRRVARRSRVRSGRSASSRRSR
ncbi:MAG: MSCRAMM family protein [Solirubrobacteraceae bacterium]